MRVRARCMFAAMFLGLTAGSLVCLAAPRESVMFSDAISNGPLGSSANDVRTANFAGGYSVGRVLVSGTLTEINTATFAGEAQIQVTAPSGEQFILDPFGTAGGFTGTITINPSPYVFTLSVPVAEAAGQWTFRFYETNDDGGTASPDASWNITITLDDQLPTPPAPPAEFIDLGTLTDAGVSECGIVIDPSSASTRIKWLRITVPQAINAARFLDIDTNGSMLNTAIPNNTEVGVYGFPYGNLVATDDDDGAGPIAVLSFGGGLRNGDVGGLIYNGRDGILQPGTYFIAVGAFNSAFAATNFGATSSSTASGTICLNIRTGPVSTGAPAATDLGNLHAGNRGTLADNIAFNPSGSTPEIKWFKFQTCTDATSDNNHFVDIDTSGSALTASTPGGTFLNDTSIGLFREDGSVVASDDDDGNGFTSQLTFGRTVPPRPAIGNGAVYDGRDGSLPAGTYYLAVGGFTSMFAAGFQAATNTAASGTIDVNFNTDIEACPPPTCPADLDDGSGSGTPDGGVTIEDLLFFLAVYEEGDVRADLDDGSFTGTPDGGVTIDDLLYYLLRYENGC